MQKSRQPAGKGGEDRMDEDRERRQWRIRIGLEKEQKPIVIRREDIKKRAERRKNRKKYQ
jgi:hypothetical protein